MLVEMISPAFKIKNIERPPIKFKKGLNVILGSEEGTMSIGKSSALLAIDFVFGGDTYLKSDGVHREGHHKIYFAFSFDDKIYKFVRDTFKPDIIHICFDNYEMSEQSYTKLEYVSWLQKKYNIDFEGLSFRTALSSFFRIYGKVNTNERSPLCGIPGQNKEKSIECIIALFDKYKNVGMYKEQVEEAKLQLKTYNAARKYNFISDSVTNTKRYEENTQRIIQKELEIKALRENVIGSSESEIEKNKLKSELLVKKLNYENELVSLEHRHRLITLSRESGLFPTEADITALQEFFPTVNIRKIYEIENYHKKLAQILDSEFEDESQKLSSEIDRVQKQLLTVNQKIKDIGVVENFSREFVEQYSSLKREIELLREQNDAYLKLRNLQDNKITADEKLKKATVTVLAEIEDILNTKMKSMNESLFVVRRKPPQIHFSNYNSYVFETPDDTGTGSNFKGMIVYDLAILQSTNLPAIAHDSLLFKNLGKIVEDGIVRIYNTIDDKQIFIAYDKQSDCNPFTQEILKNNAVLELSGDGNELYGKSWNTDLE